VAAAFCVNLAFSAVPTPLYITYQQRDHFSTLMITVVYAVYAIGVIASLFLGGHVSDWVGRRRVLVPALAVNVLSAVLFIAFPSLPGLILARIISGVSIGLTTGTATAYLAELHLGAGGSPTARRPQVVATAANLGGIGVGPLGAGLLAQFVPSPLVVPYVIFGGALVVLALLVAFAPETANRPDPRPAWRPQRVAIPAHARGTFFAATGAAAAAFAVYGVFNSLMPGFLAGTMHETSYAVAGAVAFSAFAAGAVAQIALSLLFSLREIRTEVALTPKEFAILECLAADPGRLISRQEIVERAWDEHWYGPTKVLDVHLAALRRKLGDPSLIETVYGHGFRLADRTVTAAD